MNIFMSLVLKNCVFIGRALAELDRKDKKKVHERFLYLIVFKKIKYIYHRKNQDLVIIPFIFQFSAFKNI